MTEYVCKKCKTKFKLKADYTRHLNRKTPCNKEKSSEFICEYCDKNLSRIDSLKRHLTICEKRIENVDKKKINGNNVDNNKNSIINTINKNGTINNMSNNNINIVLLNFPPDKNSIMGQEIGKILASDENYIIAMVKKTNANENKPEHHNIYYPDLKSAHGEIYSDNKWNTAKIDEILNRLLAAKAENLTDILNEFGEVLTPETKQKIINTVKDFYNDKSRKKLKSHLKVILYDVKNFVKKTRKTIEAQNKIETWNLNNNSNSNDNDNNNNSDDNNNNDSDDNDNISDNNDKYRFEKELAINLLNEMKYDGRDNELIRHIIITMENKRILNIIIALLCKKYYMGEDISVKIINQRVDDERELKSYIPKNIIKMYNNMP